MKPTIADHASVLGGSLAGGVALIPVYAVRTNPSGTGGSSGSPTHWRWPTGAKDDAREAVNRQLEGKLRWPAF